MYEVKTKVNDASVKKFLDGVKDEKKRSDSYVLLDMMSKATKKQPKMWGTSIVGFDSYHYKGKSSEGDWLLIGFSPRVQNLTLYVVGHWDHYKDLLKKLGKHSLGGGCLYIKRLEDVDQVVLKKLIAAALSRSKVAIREMQTKYSQ